MIEVLNSKRMTLVIVVLICVCSIVVLIEEWFTDSQVVITPTHGTNSQGNLTSSYNLSSNNHADVIKNSNQQQQQIQKPPSLAIDQSSAEVIGYHASSRTNIDKCWLKESFEIIKPCSLCRTFELETNHSRYHTYVHLCSKSGYKELIECSKSGPVERACYTDWKQFLSFLSLVGLFGGISGLLAKHRQYQLRCKTLLRFRKVSDSDDSNHTLIDMNFTS